MKSIGCWILLAVSCVAAELPQPVIPAGVGVNIHFVTGHERDLDMIAAAGFRFIRMDFAWTAIETNKGEYDWSSYDQLLANLDNRKIRPIFILDYSHHLYEEAVTSPHPFNGQPHKTTGSPQHPESVAAFARWAAASARHYHGRHVIWEIWNEPNIQFWSPKPDAQQYTTLAVATCKAIREVEPDATIIAPGSSGFPWDFIETLFTAGALEYLDAVSVHPYRGANSPPETAAADYRQLRELIEKYAPSSRKQKIPIISGEWGYSSHTKGVSLQTQAAFAVRQQLFDLLSGISLSIWYDWKNDGDDPKENEHNFGTVTSDLKPKPAYEAIQTMTRELAGYRVERRVPVGGENDYVVLCSDGKGIQKLAAWTIAQPHSVTVELSGEIGKAIGGSRGNTPPPMLLQLGALPQYKPVEVKSKE